MRIGFLGLGSMGTGMARNLVRAGYKVVVYNRSRNRAKSVAKEGASVAEDPAKAAGGQEIAITMLADNYAVETVALGARGIIEALPLGGLHVSMSTISPAVSERLAAAHKERGQQHVAMPVFGRPEAAAAAKLFIVAAGPKDALQKAKPVFEVLGQRTFEVGGSGLNTPITSSCSGILCSRACRNRLARCLPSRAKRRSIPTPFLRC